MSGARYQVPPTVTVLQGMKGRLTGAKKGHGLLKKKADALTLKFRQVCVKEIDTALCIYIYTYICVCDTHISRHTRCGKEKERERERERERDVCVDCEE